MHNYKHTFLQLVDRLPLTIALVIFVFLALIFYARAAVFPSASELSAAFSQYQNRPFQATSPMTGRIYQLEPIGIDSRRGEPGMFNIVVKADRVH